MLDLQCRGLKDVVTGRATHGVQRFDQWHASGKHGRQGPGPTCNAGLFNQYAEDGQLQHKTIHENLHTLVTLPGLHEEIEPAAQTTKNQIPVLNKEFAHGDHDQCWCGQLAAEGREDGFEGRNYKDHDHRDHHKSDDQNRNRVHQRRLDLGLDGFRLFHIDREAIQQLVQNTGSLASLDQVAVEVVKVQGVLSECGV